MRMRRLAHILGLDQPNLIMPLWDTPTGKAADFLMLVAIGSIALCVMIGQYVGTGPVL